MQQLSSPWITGRNDFGRFAAKAASRMNGGFDGDEMRDPFTIRIASSCT